MPPEGSGPDLASLRRLSQNARPPRRERDFNLSRTLGFLGIAVVVVALPWIVFTRLGDSGPAGRPRPSIAPSTPTPSQQPQAIKGVDPGVAYYEVVGEVECARIRLAPDTEAQILNCVKPGTRLASDGQMRTTGSLQWLHVEDPFKKIDGWIATKYVRRAPPER